MYVSTGLTQKRYIPFFSIAVRTQLTKSQDNTG